MADAAPRYTGWHSHPLTEDFIATVRANAVALVELERFRTPREYEKIAKYNRKHMKKYLLLVRAPAPTNACSVTSVRDYLLELLRKLGISREHAPNPAANEMPQHPAPLIPAANEMPRAPGPVVPAANEMPRPLPGPVNRAGHVALPFPAGNDVPQPPPGPANPAGGVALPPGPVEQAGRVPYQPRPANVAGGALVHPRLVNPGHVPPPPPGPPPPPPPQMVVGDESNTNMNKGSFNMHGSHNPLTGNAGQNSASGPYVENRSGDWSAQQLPPPPPPPLAPFQPQGNPIWHHPPSQYRYMNPMGHHDPNQRHHMNPMVAQHQNQMNPMPSQGSHSRPQG